MKERMNFKSCRDVECDRRVVGEMSELASRREPSYGK